LHQILTKFRKAKRDSKNWAIASLILLGKHMLDIGADITMIEI